MSVSPMPILTVAQREVQIARTIKANIPPFPVTLQVEGFKKTSDPITGDEIVMPKLKKLEDDGISYTVRDLPSADYIVRNPSNGRVTVIKRMTMEDILKFWSTRGKRVFRQMFTELRSTFKDVDVELVIEDYYFSIPHPTDNCFWVVWRFDESKSKTDKLNNSRYANASLKRFNVHPREFIAEMDKMGSMNIKVIKCADSKGMYNHLMELIFGSGDPDEDPIRPVVSVVSDLFPFLPEDILQNMVKQYPTIADLIIAITSTKDVSAFGVPNLSDQNFATMRAIVVKKE